MAMVREGSAMGTQIATHYVGPTIVLKIQTQSHCIVWRFGSEGMIGVVVRHNHTPRVESWYNRGETHSCIFK